MTSKIRRADYYYVTVRDEPGAAYRLLNQLAGLGINLLAFAAVPTGPGSTQLTLFPEDPGKMKAEAARDGIALDGPHTAFLVQGDDELGMLAKVHARLADADVDVFASSGVTDGAGSFGYVLYIRPEHVDQAAQALGL